MADSEAMQRFRSRGGSMFPFVPAGSVLSVRAVASSDLRVGDILCVVSVGGEVVAHRLAAAVVPGEPLRLRGDAGFGEERVPLSALVGRVEHVQRGAIGYATDGLLSALMAAVALRHRAAFAVVSGAARAFVRLRRRVNS